MLELQERLAARTSEAGGLEDASCTGQLNISVLDKNADLAGVQISIAPPLTEIKFKLHPNFNRRSFDESRQIELRESRCHAVGKDTPILKWRRTFSSSESFPVSLLCRSTMEMSGKRV